MWMQDEEIAIAWGQKIGFVAATRSGEKQRGATPDGGVGRGECRGPQLYEQTHF